MRTALWVVQLVSAAVFMLSGAMKLTMPIADLTAQLPTMETLPSWVIRFIAICEIAGAAGLVLPALLRIRPWLTPLAATGLGVLMAMAAGMHLARGEYLQIVINGVLFAMLAFVAWGRFKAAPIIARGKLSARSQPYRGDTASALT